MRALLARLQRDEPHTLQTQTAICEIPAPPFEEKARATDYRRRFEEVGLDRVRIDAEGNVVGERPGTGDGPTLLVSAHLDTVFARGTDVSVRQDGRILRAPGISDDSRGLAVVLALARALGAEGIRTRGTVVFAGTVGEEGEGDLRGVRHLLDKELRGRVDAFVSIDGSGLDTVTDAVGSRRLRVLLSGPGGHSFADFGTPNPVHALGSAVGRIGAMAVAEESRSTFSVGRIGGGTAVNAIPREAWCEIDLRSLDESVLAEMEAGVRADVEAAAEVEMEGSTGEGVIEITIEPMGRRPAATQPPNAPIIAEAIRAGELLGREVPTRPSSTDANYPMSLGTPSITLGGGGRSGGAHTLEEWFDPDESHLGPQRAMLHLLAMVGMAG